MFNLTQNQKVLLSCALGSLIAWYDFVIFGVATALVFSKLFFPDMGMIVPILVFASGFVIRPLGSIVFGHYGDRIGRKTTLIWTLLLTGISTVAIGLLPTYQDIGIMATILLVLARVTQTFAMGGEFAAATTMLTEFNVKSPRRGVIASLVISSFILATLLSSVMFMLVTKQGDEFFLTWGWRIPFLLSALLLVIGVYTRQKVLETPVFEQQVANAPKKAPLVEVFKQYKGRVFLGAAVFQLMTAWFYIMTVFGFAWVVSNNLIDRPTLTQTQLAFIPIWFAAIFAWAWVGDRIPRVRVFQLAGILSLILFYPIVYWLSVGNVAYVMAALVLVVFPSLAVAPAFVAEIFPASMRQTGSGITYNLGQIIGGGLALIVVQNVVASTGNIMNIAWVFLAVTLLSLWASFAIAKYPDLIQINND